MVTAKRFPTFSIRLWQATVLLFALACMVSALRAQGYPQGSYPQQSYPQQGYPQQGMPPGGQQPGYGDPNQGDPNQPDPPASVVRLSILQGNVSLQPAGVPDFSAASINYPLTNGDRLYTDNGALAELEAGQLAVRMGGQTDLSVTAMTDTLLQFGLGQGSVHLRSYSFDPNSTIELDTPNAAITVLDAGDVRVDVSPDGNSTQVTLLYGQARVDGQGVQQTLRPGESLMVSGSGPAYAQDVRRPRADSLDGFSSSRDSQYQTAIAADGDYVSPDTVGAADLGAYGDWAPNSDYGPVWYPRGVAADWQPYSYGRWAYVAPWGWTWVENEPWGFAPFHYGRWARFPNGRWGWIPGPRVVRPVYSPALVVFVGGGAGVTAWFPLGPREPFVPWYRTSTLYVNRVNVTNIYNRNVVEVRNGYNQRNVNIFVNNPNRGYINRPLATVAIRQDAFASGRPVRDAGVRVMPDRLDRAPILQHPGVNPTRTIMAPVPPRALPRHIERPPVETRGPQGPGGYRGGNNGQPGFPRRDQPGQNQPGQQFPNGGGNNGQQPGFPRRDQPGQNQPGQQFPNGGGNNGQQPGFPRRDQPGQNQPGQNQPGQNQPSNGGGNNGQQPGFPRRDQPGQNQPGQQFPNGGGNNGQQPGFPRRDQPGQNQPGQNQPGQNQPSNGGGNNGQQPGFPRRDQPGQNQQPNGGGNNGQPFGSNEGDINNHHRTMPIQTQPSNGGSNDGRPDFPRREQPGQNQQPNGGNNGQQPGFPRPNQPVQNQPAQPVTPTRPVETTPQQPTRPVQQPPQQLRQPDPVRQPQPILQRPVEQPQQPQERPQFHPLAPPPQQPRPQVQPQQTRPPAPARTDHPHEEKKDDHK